MSPSHLLGESRSDTVAYTGTHPLLMVDSVVQVLPISQMRDRSSEEDPPCGRGTSCAWKSDCLTPNTMLCVALSLFRSGFWVWVFWLPAQTSGLSPALVLVCQRLRVFLGCESLSAKTEKAQGKPRQVGHCPFWPLARTYSVPGTSSPLFMHMGFPEDRQERESLALIPLPPSLLAANPPSLSTSAHGPGCRWCQWVSAWTWPSALTHTQASFLLLGHNCPMSPWREPV